MLGTIEQELALCCKAFEGIEVGWVCWCIHHEKLCERLNEPAKNRIQFILINKPEEERARRLHEMRPGSEEMQTLYAERDAVYAKWQPEFDAVDAKWRAELDAVYAKWQPERDAVDAKWRAELDAVYAKRRAEFDAVDAKWQPELDAVYAKLTAMHLAECPDTTWDGQTIFPKGRR
jgi:hypothetical protein